MYKRQEEPFYTRQGKDLLRLAGYDVGSDALLVLGPEGVGRCSLVPSFMDGSCGFWSVVNALPITQGKSGEERVSELKGVLSEEIMDMAFGTEWEERQESRISPTEANILRSECFEGDTFECCPSCRSCLLYTSPSPRD